MAAFDWMLKGRRDIRGGAGCPVKGVYLIRIGEMAQITISTAELIALQKVVDMLVMGATEVVVLNEHYDHLLKEKKAYVDSLNR